MGFVHFPPSVFVSKGILKAIRRKILLSFVFEDDSADSVSIHT